MNIPHIGFTLTRRKGLARYRANQRAARHVQPKRRHDDATPMWLAYAGMAAFSITATWGMWLMASRVIPALRHAIAVMWGVA